MEISSQVVRVITWGGEQFDCAIYYYVKKEDFYEVVTISGNMILNPTCVGKQGLRAYQLK